MNDRVYLKRAEDNQIIISDGGNTLNELTLKGSTLNVVEKE